MSGRLSGKKALVTAAAQGIGRAIAQAFAAAGAEVIATDINEAKLGELAATARLVPLRLDVLDQAAIAQLVAAHGPFDVLMNCAGFVHNGTILDCSPEDWAFSMRLNVESMYNTIRAVLPGMLARGAGSIINIASVVSSLKAAPNRFVYGTSKGAVLALTKAVAIDFITRGVRCNAVCPGTVDTPSLAQRIAAFEDQEAARKAFIARQPMGRLGTAEEIAPICIYLASDESSYATGAVFTVDGGQTL
jgi:2-keto-3-deoxy-L-fuconate dehydrogenase